MKKQAILFTVFLQALLSSFAHADEAEVTGRCEHNSEAPLSNACNTIKLALTTWKIHADPYNSGSTQILSRSIALENLRFDQLHSLADQLPASERNFEYSQSTGSFIDDLRVVDIERVSWKTCYQENQLQENSEKLIKEMLLYKNNLLGLGARYCIPAQNPAGFEPHNPGAIAISACRQVGFDKERVISAMRRLGSQYIVARNFIAGASDEYGENSVEVQEQIVRYMDDPTLGRQLRDEYYRSDSPNQELDYRTHLHQVKSCIRYRCHGTSSEKRIPITADIGIEQLQGSLVSSQENAEYFSVETEGLQERLDNARNIMRVSDGLFHTSIGFFSLAGCLGGNIANCTEFGYNFGKAADLLSDQGELSETGEMFEAFLNSEEFEVFRNANTGYLQIRNMRDVFTAAEAVRSSSNPTEIQKVLRPNWNNSVNNAVRGGAALAARKIGTFLRDRAVARAQRSLEALEGAASQFSQGADLERERHTLMARRLRNLNEKLSNLTEFSKELSEKCESFRSNVDNFKDLLGEHCGQEVSLYGNATWQLPSVHGVEAIMTNEREEAIAQARREREAREAAELEEIRAYLRQRELRAQNLRRQKESLRNSVNLQR